MPDGAPARPILRYHGGKWRLAPWVIAHFPQHRVYVEPFGGAGSVLMRKPRAHAEVYNDRWDEVVNLFRVLREPALRGRLIEAVALTPFARLEFEQSYEATDDPVERARRLLIRSHMGFGSNGCALTLRTGFRANSHRSNTTPAMDWTGVPSTIAAVASRLDGVVVEHRDWREVCDQHDSPETLHFLDPPYPHGARSRSSAGRGYAHEMTDEQHAEMCTAAQGLAGYVVISSYPNALYDAALPGWTRVDRAALADGARARTESLYLSSRTVAALATEQGRLDFGGPDA